MPDAGPVISAKNLGAFAVPDACQRCLWVNLHISQLPYQVPFPGVFSTLDSYQKRVVHGYFDRERRMPDWLRQVGDVVDYVPPPSYHKFAVVDNATGVTLRGTADGIFRLRPGGHAIVDYKTARYTSGQDAMLPIYQVQLNAYAFIGDRVGYAPVSRLALVYFEPLTDPVVASEPATVNDAGFTLGLSARVVPVDLRPNSIPPLLDRVRQVYDRLAPPAPREDCPDCAALATLLERLKV